MTPPGPLLDAEAGSVLIEALAAAAILAMILGAIYQVAADGAARRQMMDARRQALLIARSQLEAVGREIPLTGGEADGKAGDDLWRVSMQPCGQGRTLVGTLYCVTVSVGAARGEPLVTLSTRRLAPAT